MERGNYEHVLMHQWRVTSPRRKKSEWDGIYCFEYAWGSREVAPFKLRKNGVINQNIGENERVGKADSPTAGGI